MKKFLCGAFCCHVALAAAADPALSPGAYASAAVGSGHIDGGRAGADRGMRGRAVELRFGHAFSDASDVQRLRLDVVHVNEGHPDNHHRDGFALQLVYARQLGRWATAEVAAGPYLSMNTTVIDGTQRNDGNVGLLTSVALRIPLNSTLAGLDLRLGVNRVTIPGVHDSTSWLLGIGRAFSPAPPAAVEPLWLGGSVGNAITNMSGIDDAPGATLEARRRTGAWALSAKLIAEGDDGAKVDRRGVAAQAWYVQQLTRSWALAAGVGPYAAANKRDGDDVRLHALISLAAEYALRERTHLTISFSRVKTLREKNDRDLFHVGVLQAFGR